MQLERIIWFAMLISTAIYAAIAYVFGAHPTHSFESNFHDVFVVIMYALTVFFFFIATFLPNVTMSKSPPRVRWIISLAFYESCAIYGVVPSLLHHDWRLYPGPWAVCLLGFARLFPNRVDGLTGST